MKTTIKRQDVQRIRNKVFPHLKKAILSLMNLILNNDQVTKHNQETRKQRLLNSLIQQLKQNFTIEDYLQQDLEDMNNELFDNFSKQMNMDVEILRQQVQKRQNYKQLKEEELQQLKNKKFNPILYIANILKKQNEKLKNNGMLQNDSNILY